MLLILSLSSILSEYFFLPFSSVLFIKSVNLLLLSNVPMFVTSEVTFEFKIAFAPSSTVIDDWDTSPLLAIKSFVLNVVVPLLISVEPVHVIPSLNSISPLKIS